MHDNEPVIPSPNPAGWPQPAAPAPTRRFHRAPLVAGAVVASFFLVGLGVAYAQSDSPSTTATTLPAVVPPPAGQIVPAPTQPPAQGKGFGRGGHGHGHGGLFGGKLFGLGGFGRFGGLHGEFTMRKPDGTGFQTVAVQTGEVTAVSPSSITVKSEDGFSRTYSVDENTVVGAGRDGIGTVKTGDTVRIAGVVEDGKAKAAGILDSTSLDKIGEHWGFPKRK
jgi:hypothetical protein